MDGKWMVMSENKRFKPKKASIKRLIIAFILIAAVVAGIYALLTKGNEEAREPDNIKVHTEENQKEVKTEKAAEEEEPEPTKGNVTKEIPANKSDGTIKEGSTNKNDTSIKMPKYNKDAIIANAKKQVYTVYTDLQQGSGFLMNRKGDILTNAHVVKDAGFVVVKNIQGQEFQGEVIGISKKTDVALIRVPDLEGKDPLVLDTKTATVGTKVVAIGSPKDQYGTTTEGIIQSIGAEFIDDYTYDHLYEITAKLNTGSSGGPLINAETGNVIGINSIILEDHPEIGYAIPLSAVIGLVNEWAAQEVDINFDDIDEFENNHADEAYFEDVLLKENMYSFYELVKQSLINGKYDYYEPYILENSEALKKAKEIFDNYASNKVYKSLTYDIGTSEIGEESSNITVSTVYTYIDQNTKLTQTIKDTITYTIIIDEFGQYMISKVVVDSSVDTGAIKEVEKPKTKPKPKPSESETPVVEEPKIEEPEVEEPEAEEPETEEPVNEEQKSKEPLTSETEVEEPKASVSNNNSVEKTEFMKPSSIIAE